MKNDILATKNWVLSILGIILLSLVIILPPVFRLLNNDKVVESDNNETPTVVTTSLTCYKEGITDNNYVSKESYVFTSKDNKLKSYVKKNELVYNDPLLYQEEKPNYGKLVTAFSIITGYNYSATPKDDTFTMIITETFNLKDFHDTMIVIPDDTTPTTIVSEYLLDQDSDAIKTELTTDGYTCS